jgi:hypothetical protein
MKAFPRNIDNYGYQDDYSGMNLRDYFAAKAMQALVAKTVDEDEPAEIAAEAAYMFADAMMEARE